MMNVLLQTIKKLNTSYQKKKWFRWSVRAMAMIVVFCTTYVLILPAITMKGDPACGFEVHVHTESCYSTCPIYTYECDLDDSEQVLHTHNIFCYDAHGNLICNLPQIAAHPHENGCCSIEMLDGVQLKSHDHSQACLVETGRVEQILTCLLPEHSHTDICYPLEGSVKSEYLCSSGQHSHSEECYDVLGKLSCTIPEHTHDASCLVANLDLTADVETPEQWETYLRQLTLTGNFPKDIVAIAQMQLNYQESQKNVSLQNGELKGYTRFGAWYGDPYGSWDAMFASFVLEHAFVEGFPLSADPGLWTDILRNADRYADAQGYFPKPGDLIFFDYDQGQGRSDHVGIVVGLIPAIGDQPARIKTIEGDINNKVTYASYPLNDSTIMGYGVVPSGDTTILAYRGEDYMVTVSFGLNANIPQNARLSVREILPGTEEYERYYRESVEAMVDGIKQHSALTVSFARFFDISFVVDGRIVEPTAKVRVQISYSDEIPQNDEEGGVAVHFTESGIELLDAQTSSSVQEGSSQVDTFDFAQNSFSVVGTVISNYPRAIGTTSATIVNFNNLSASGSIQYVIYTEYNGQYYALKAKDGDVTGYAVPITVNRDGTISWDTIDTGIFWSFTRNGTSGNSYYIQNYGTGRYVHAFDNSIGSKVDYGTTTAGKNPSTLTAAGNGTFIAQGKNYYTGVAYNNGTVTFNRVSNQSQAARFYLAVVGDFYNVWFDGTNGGLMGLYGSDDLNSPAVKNANGTPTIISLPETWKSPTKYGYVLQGWYDITSQTYYKVDPTDDKEVTAPISRDTVFYADWIAATYDVGVENEYVVDSVDTSNFVTTHVFDYNSLFNVLSLTQAGDISSASHSETWSMVQNGNRVPYQNGLPLKFTFVDYDAGGDISYANGRDTQNNNQGSITEGIIDNVAASGRVDLMDLLFNPNTSVIGKNYVGTGNYLFQYMDSTTENYDGEHDGYYYLDARLNAASYNKTFQRFYVYDYLERTSDSRKDGGTGIYSDFLPFNSPYLFNPDQLDNYVNSIMRPGYEYDAKDVYSDDRGVFSSVDDAGTNYWFGMSTGIEFFLPDDSGDQDQYGNYGNISTRGEHMVFEFHGDDDLWVFVDGELLLDVGGIHGVMYGEIDFSTGTVTSGQDGGSVTTKTFREILGHNIDDGTHTMVIYYLERGSSQSNCSIYFNIAPRYDLEITKEDIYSTEKLNGAVFSIYTCEACANDICQVHDETQVAQLWDSEEDYHADMADNSLPDSSKYQFTVIDGIAKCWGVSAGKTYYIKETTPPVGYPAPGDDLIRITLNNRGTATIEATTLHGPDGEVTEGYLVLENSVNDTMKIVSMLFTNQKDEETTKVRVEKIWDPQATDLPNSIVVYLTADGQRVPRYAVLTEENGWTHTWTGLPKYRLGPNGERIEVEYVAEEIQVPGFETKSIIRKNVPEHIKWTKTAAMEDGATYILLNGGRALAYNASSGFYWMTQADAQDSTAGLDAQWSVTTNQYGFRLNNGSGYYLTYDRGTNDNNDRFYGSPQLSDIQNQVIYYLENRLVAHDHDEYFQLDLNGNAVSVDGLVFSLVRKDLVSGTIIEIENSLVDNDDQTYVEVNKQWADDLDHSEHSVVIHLYADGVDTGRVLILSDENGWHDSFDGLPYYRTDGKTPIVYTVVEDEPPEYDASYESQIIDGLQIVTWIKVNDLSQSGYYRIVTGANALSIDTEGHLIVAVNDPNNQSQWWTPVRVGARTVLKHAVYDLYLADDGNNVIVVNNSSGASTVVLSNDALTLDGKYLQMTKTSITVSEFPYNATLFTVAIRTEGKGMPGLSITVTNGDQAEYQLPATGGSGIISLYAFGSMLIMAAVLMYMSNLTRKRQKGGNDT